MPHGSIARVEAGGTVAGAIAVIAITFAGSTLLTPLYVLYEARLGFSPAVLTIIYAAYVIGNAAALLFLGRLSDNVGRKPVALSAISLCGLAALLFLLARSSVWLFAGRVVSGFAVGLGSATGAAWLTDLYGDRPEHATLLAAEANLGGVGTAPLAAGALAARTASPLVTPFIAYGAALALVALMICKSMETVKGKAFSPAMLRPQVALPENSTGFLAPAITGFVVFGFVGYYAALLPSILRHSMGLTNPVIGGAILTELFAVSMIAMPLTRRIASDRAMLAGLAAVVPGLLLLVGAQIGQSLALLIAATAFGGISLALGYRGSLEVVAAIAPADQRAGIMSAYFLACFAGNALPVIGVGVATMAFGWTAASEMFAVVMLALAILGFAVRLRLER
jgi:MFS family permease